MTFLQSQEQTKLQIESVDAANKAVEIALAQYRGGQVDFNRVAVLELQLVQQDLAQLQARFEEGKVSLQEIEKTRLDENEKWMALLDATFQRQQAQLDLLKSAGQLDKVLE